MSQSLGIKSYAANVVPSPHTVLTNKVCFENKHPLILYLLKRRRNSSQRCCDHSVVTETGTIEGI